MSEKFETWWNTVCEETIPFPAKKSAARAAWVEARTSMREECAEMMARRLVRNCDCDACRQLEGLDKEILAAIQRIKE